MNRGGALVMVAVGVVLLAAGVSSGADGGDAVAAFERFKAVMLERESLIENVHYEHVHEALYKRGSFDLPTIFEVTLTDEKGGNNRAEVTVTSGPTEDRRTSSYAEIMNVEKGIRLTESTQVASIVRAKTGFRRSYGPWKFFVVNNDFWSVALENDPCSDFRMDGDFLEFKIEASRMEKGSSWSIVRVDTRDDTVRRVEHYLEKSLWYVCEYDEYEDAGDGLLFPLLHIKRLYDRKKMIESFHEGLEVLVLNTVRINVMELNKELPEDYFALVIPNGYTVMDDIRGVQYVQGEGVVPADVIVESVVDDAMENFGEEMVEEVREVAAETVAVEEAGPVAQDVGAGAAEAEAPEDEETRWALVFAVAVLAAAAVATVMLVAKKRAKAGK